MEQNKKSESKPSKELAVPKKTQIKPIKKPAAIVRRRTKSQGDIEQAFDQAFDIV